MNMAMMTQFLLHFSQESYTYKDPITEFVECLYVNFDFDSAQKKLRECESVSNHFSNPNDIQPNLFFPNYKELVLVYCASPWQYRGLLKASDLWVRLLNFHMEHGSKHGQ